MKGAELFAACLKAQGVEWAGALCGNGLNEILAACGKRGIRIVDARNEQTAAYMADGWGRLTGRVGVCMVSSGVAHASALTGVVNARFDGAPMLLVSGSGPLETAGMGHFQDMDQVGLAAPACRYARLIDRPERIPEFVREAFAAALQGGPAHLTFPMDVQEAEVGEEVSIPAAEKVRAARPAPEPIARAAELLEEVERPLIVAGSGTYYSGAERALADFSAAFSIPVVIPIWDRGSVPERTTEYMGVIGAATGGPRLLDEADLVILIGAEIDYRTGYLRPPAVDPACRVIRIDADPDRLNRGRPVDLAIWGSPGSALEQLQEACTARRIRGFEEWRSEAEKRKVAFRSRIEQNAVRKEGSLHALDIVEVLGRFLTPETILLVDGGNIGQWFHQTLARDQYPGHWLTCGASGVVGFGIGAAMAAKAGFPKRPVVLLSGDGSATFNFSDLERAARQELPFVMIVADDECWGIVESGQVERYGEAMSSRLGSIDFAGVARGLGALGTRVEKQEDLERAILQGLRENVPVLVHAPISGGTPKS